MKRLVTAAAILIRSPRSIAGCIRSLRAKGPFATKRAGHKRRILLVDDESALTMLCRLMLEQTDFIVKEESLGSRVVSTARKFRPDVIFLDLCLPDKDGREVAAELQKDPKLRNVPIVFWSGSFLRKRNAVDNMHGVWPALPKPFSNEELTQFAINPVHPRPERTTRDFGFAPEASADCMHACLPFPESAVLSSSLSR